MLLHLATVLTVQELEVVRKLLKQAQFVEGASSAGMMAQGVKKNLEINMQSPQISKLNNIVMGNLVRHPQYSAAAFPVKVASPFYAVYSQGMHYGDHVDNPIMGQGAYYRSDIAITVFLNSPDEYQGGELVINSSFGEKTVKLPAGDAVLYPASSLHHVNPVTEGERYVAVTWVQSMIRSAEQREILYNLCRIRDELLADKSTEDKAKRLDNVYVNLVRMWAEV